MATKRRPLHSQPGGAPKPQMNFRPAGADTTRQETKGTRPTAEPTSVREVFTMMVLHVCKKSIFFDTNLKVALYLGSLFLVSLIGDFIPFPKTYFARSDNLFNVYFVKMGWAWTLIMCCPFLLMTSFTLCCGDANRFVRNHLPRIAIATVFWFVWTKFFTIIESSYGRCSIKNYDNKVACLKAGHFWHGFDISGHAFILIYSSLVLIEEARPIVNWESIKDFIRDEEYCRSMKEKSTSNPLRNLKDDEMRKLKYLYEKYTPAIRIWFIGMTALQLLWDIMLVCTMLYYHRMIEKVLSGIIAILTWYFTYRSWYPSNSLLPDSAGSGVFNYKRAKSQTIPLKRRSSLLMREGASPKAASAQAPNDVPKFMGLPLYGLNQTKANSGDARQSD